MAEAKLARARAVADFLLSRPIGRCVVVAAGCLVLANCSSSRMSADLGVPASPKVIPDGQPVPKGGGRTMTGKPYVVSGRVYRPMSNPHGYTAVGTASWYGSAFRGRYTSNHEIFDGAALSAAHPTLPLPSYVRVTDLDNGRSVIVRVNDRGPFHGGRLIDVSKMTAEVLGFRRNGTAPVRITYVGPANLAGSDDRKLLATYEVNGRPARPDVALAASFPPPPRRNGAPALLAALVPAPLSRAEEAERPEPVPAVVPLPAPPERIAVAAPAPAPAARAPLRLARNDLMPPSASDPIGQLVAEGHPPMPQPRRFAYAPGIEPTWQRPAHVRGPVTAAAQTPVELGSPVTAARRVHAGFAGSGYREPIPLRPSLVRDVPEQASALAPLY
ncbi:MAG TPA: septal ring lytic transglycosylase RlpA family protein [Hyphomicrobiales bacterium]|nr:septal ring lytic transglycosylase RlpA family protein [Hyphomicrobiales bacterium]